MTPEQLNSRIFAEYLHTAFQIEIAGGEPLAVELVEVEDKNISPKFEQFSIVFRGPHQSNLEQAIYPVEHPTMGRFELFLVPVGPDEQGMCYEAVFNRRRQEPEPAR